ncbi:MAG: hypothetical protein WC284_03745 [Candidimonas sp.]
MTYDSENLPSFDSKEQYKDWRQSWKIDYVAQSNRIRQLKDERRKEKQHWSREWKLLSERKAANEMMLTLEAIKERNKKIVDDLKAA